MSCRWRDRSYVRLVKMECVLVRDNVSMITVRSFSMNCCRANWTKLLWILWAIQRHQLTGCLSRISVLAPLPLHLDSGPTCHDHRFSIYCKSWAQAEWNILNSFYAEIVWQNYVPHVWVYTLRCSQATYKLTYFLQIVAVELIYVTSVSLVARAIQSISSDDPAGGLMFWAF